MEKKPKVRRMIFVCPMNRKHVEFVAYHSVTKKIVIDQYGEEVDHLDDDETEDPVPPTCFCGAEAKEIWEDEQEEYWKQKSK